jgi:prepilin-type N-terminal cleavage/methylation domain-containing protein
MRRSNNKGFTLIELLIVVVIIGILAAIAIPKFSEAREKAFVSAMKSDLKNLATQEELYYADAFEYSTDKTALEFSESKNVTVTPGGASTDGWGAQATHEGTSITCSLYYGTGGEGSAPDAAAAGVVACSNETTS